MTRSLINQAKKFALMTALLLTACISYSFAATGDEINSEIRSNFSRDFQNSRVINAEVHKGFTKLTFKMNDMIMFAFYSDNGQLLAVTRNILSTQLPMDLMMSLKSDYNAYWITELFEISGEGQNCYYISMENAGTKLILRSNGDQNWEVYEKKAKN